jgi:hypothetical protein
VPEVRLVIRLEYWGNAASGDSGAGSKPGEQSGKKFSVFHIVSVLSSLLEEE